MRLKLVPALHRAVHKLGLYIQARQPSLSQGEAHVLAHLHEVARCPIAELHRAFAHKRSTLTSILDRLHARGLVRRELRSDDRRSFLVSLTPRGARLARGIHADLGALESAVLAEATGQELLGLLKLVEAAERTATAAARGKERGR
jgi:DNA-binding MarR family transcriptional regulator